MDSIPLNYYRPFKSDYLRLIVFCLSSILLHAFIIHSIKLPIKDSVIKDFKPIPVTINKLSTQPIAKIIKKNPAQDIKSKAKLTSTLTPPGQSVNPTQQKYPKPSLKRLKQVTAPALTKIQNEIIKSENPLSALNSIQLRNESLNFISEMILEEESTDKDSYVFDPVLQQKINQAQHDKVLQQELYPDELELSVDDKNTEVDGYRETIVNGDCWLIPIDNSFDPLDSRIVMLNPNCNKPKDILFDLIKSLK